MAFLPEGIIVTVFICFSKKQAELIHSNVLLPRHLGSWTHKVKSLPALQWGGQSSVGKKWDGPGREVRQVREGCGIGGGYAWEWEDTVGIHSSPWHCGAHSMPTAPCKV